MGKYILLSLAVLIAPSLAAQQRDSVRRVDDTVEVGRLRQRVDSVFSMRVQHELQLTPDQTTKLRSTQERFSTRRRTLMVQQMQRRVALQDQMQPGVAANSDSVRKLMDGIQAGRAEMVKIEQDQDREMSGDLTPVQRARYQQMRERFMQRIGEMRMERRETRGMRPGMRPGMVPRQGLRGGRRRGI